MAAQPALAQQPDRPGRFDSYVLALSWSPAWCEGKADAEQCGSQRFGFVVHGLWPQHLSGGWPERCAVGGRLPEAVVRDMLPIMPSRKLIAHQWNKHGTCDGTPVQDYFARVRQAHGRVVIPEWLRAPDTPKTVTLPEIEAAFIAVNPGLTADGLAIVCKGGKVSEVRVCLTRGLDFTRCGDGVRDSCRGKAKLVPVN